MSETFTLDQIRSFWADQVKQHGLSPEASWSDINMIEMEIKEVAKLLEDGDKVLDVGCANGFSTIELARQKKVSIRGLDYIPGMIEQAKIRLSQCDSDLKTRVQFDEGDITQLKEPLAAYDKIVVVRVLINLRTWELQQHAIDQCIRVLKPGGLLIFSEATLQGWESMNRFRKEWLLTEIPIPPFNEYLDQTKVIESLSSKLELIEVNNFSSTYFVATRILKPLLSQLLSSNIDVAKPEMEWNRWFSQVPAYGDYGTQKLFVFRKPSA